jgi:hypothetical protein
MQRRSTVPRRTQLSLILTPSAGVDHAGLPLTDDERAAVVELALRPTYGLHYAPQLDVDAMLANAGAWMQAAEITSAGNAGWIPRALRREITQLLVEAAPESLLDLESTIRSRDRWRAGDADQGFPEVGPEETEAVYAELIDNEQRHADALRSIAAKLELADAPDL